MNSLPKLADESILAKEQLEQNLISFLDQNFHDDSLDFIQYLQFFPNLEKLGNFIDLLLKTLVNDIFTSADQELFHRSICALLFEFSKRINSNIEREYLSSQNNVEIETVKDKLNDSLIQIQTLENNLKNKDEIINQLTNDNNELEKNVAKLKAKILKKKEKIDDLKLHYRKNDIHQDEEKLSIINQTLTSQISSIPTDNNYDKLVDEILSLSNTIKFNDYEFKRLLESKHYCLNICQRLLDLCEEYESRVSMVEEDKAILNQQISRILNDNNRLKKIIEQSNKNENIFLLDDDLLEDKILEESKAQMDNKIDPDQKLQEEIESLNITIKNQKRFINTLSSYIDRIITEGDDFIPLLYQTSPAIHDNSLRKIILESVESIKTNLCIDDYTKDENQKNTQIDSRNHFFTQIFGNSELLEQFINNATANNNENQECAVVVALCAANINLGTKFKDITSRLSDLHSKLPKEYQDSDAISSFHKFLVDSKDIFDKINQINDTSSFFRFVSSDFKTSIDDFLTEITNFISSLQENIYPILHYNKSNLSELPTILINYINNIQTQVNELKIELDDYKLKYKNEYQSNNSQQRYSDELIIKMKEKEYQINCLQKYIKEKEKESADFKLSSESILNEKDLTIQNYEKELNKIIKENETNSLLLKNTKKLYKSQIDNVIRIERDKKEKEIKEIKQTNEENEKVLISKLESKKKKVKNLQNQIKELSKLFEKKMKKNTEKTENIINQTNNQINILEESFKQKEKQYQDEIEMLKGKLLEEIQSNSTIKFIEVPTPLSYTSSIDIKNNNDDFVKQILNILSDFPNSKLNMKMGSSFSTETAQSKILKTLQQLINDVKNNPEKSKINNELTDSINDSMSIFKSPIITAKRVVNTRDLKIWESWAVELALIMNVPTDSLSEIRTAIRDIVLSENSKRFMLRNVQSLRIQKKILLENNLYKLKISTRNAVDLKGIIFFFISISCMAKIVKKRFKITSDLK